MNISVIIPTYKPQDYLWECLDSIAAQTISKDAFEVIVILNGPKDPFYGKIEDYAEDSGLDLKLIYTEVPGVSNARNIGLDNASGKYIAFMDDDDKISPTYLHELYAKASEDTVVISNVYNYHDDRPDELISIRPTELHRQLSEHGKTGLIESRRFFFAVWMMLIPKAVIGSRRFDPSFSIGEDCLFMFLISDRIKHTDFTSDKAVYFRRLRSGSAMSSQKSRWKTAWNDIRMMAAYTQMYLSGLRRYSFFFYLTRIRGAIHLEMFRKKVQ